MREVIDNTMNIIPDWCALLLSDIFISRLNEAPLLRIRGEDRGIVKRECQGGRAVFSNPQRPDREWVFPADPRGAESRGVHRCI